METSFSELDTAMNKHAYNHIDLSYLYEIADDDTDFVKEMISDYIAKVPEQIAELQKEFGQRNFGQTRFIAHKIKSSFQFMGAQKLVELAHNIEKISQEENTQAIERDLTTMEPIVKEVLTELQHQLSIL